MAVFCNGGGAAPAGGDQGQRGLVHLIDEGACGSFREPPEVVAGERVVCHDHELVGDLVRTGKHRTS